MVAALSTVDFLGVFTYSKNPLIGKAIAFDAKETEKETSFPLANIKQHQLIFLDLFEQAGGVGFFLIHFKEIYDDKAFVTPVSLVNKYWYGTGRRSIPLSDFLPSWLTPIDTYLEYFYEQQVPPIQGKISDTDDSVIYS